MVEEIIIETEVIGDTIDTDSDSLIGTPGINGVTFTPSVSEEGIISWTNDGGLENPDPINIKGNDGEKGEPGDAFTYDMFTPEQLESLKGEQGDKGDKGDKGEQGEMGIGVPSGGKEGQILTKTSDDDYDTEWKDITSIDVKVPTKVSELENDSNYLSMNDDYSHVTGRLHVSNKFDTYVERPVDISTKYLMGAEDGGLPGTLYINYNVDKDVRILEKGTGTLYYKGNEVADRYYVDEQIANIEVNGGVDLSDYAKKDEIPTKTSELENDSGYVINTDYASSDNVGLVKTESYYGLHTSSRTGTLYCEQFSYDEYTNEKDGNCFVSKGTLENVLEAKDYASKGYVDEQISNIEASGGTGGSDYELPIASSETLGGIKVGANLTIDEDGTLNATASGGEGTNTIAIDNLPVGSVVAFDGEEIPYGYEEVEDYMPIYSTEEQVVGTYLDKPLYKKTYTGTINLEYAGTYYTQIKLDNGEKFKRVIDIKGFLSDTTNEVGNLYDIHIEGVFPIKLSNGIVDLRTPQMFYNKYFEATLYYTKTTDEEV